jgi:hypothetical protein
VLNAKPRPLYTRERLGTHFRGGWEGPRPGLDKCENFTPAVHKIWSVAYLRPRQLSRYSDWLRAGRSGYRIPVGARFFAPVQTSPGAHPASCPMGTGSFPGVKRPEHGSDHPPTSSDEVKKVIAIPLPPDGPMVLLRGTFTFWVIHRRL